MIPYAALRAWQVSLEGRQGAKRKVEDGEKDQEDAAALGHNPQTLGESIHNAVIKCFLSNLNLPG